MRLLIAAGGTGGHLRPALAVAEALLRLDPSSSILFLTAGRKVGERFFEGCPFERQTLFPGRESAPQRRDLIGWWRAYRRARRVLAEFDPDLVVGFGGYPTAVAGVAALSGRLGLAGAVCRWLAGAGGRRLVLLEQNACPGLAVKILSRVAESVLLSLPLAPEALSGRTSAIHTGNPLPSEFNGENGCPVDAARFGLEPGRPTLLALGGSQGARGVNQMVLAARPLLQKRHPNLQILLITGEDDLARVQMELEREPLPCTVAVPFETRMRDVYRLADVVVARAGGTTLAELAVVGRPMVLVPYPHHRDRHQFKNAEAFVRVGAARVVPEGERSAERLVTELDHWFCDREARLLGGARARELGLPGAAVRCAELILKAGEVSR